MPHVTAWLVTGGFDIARLRFALRTALACSLAVILAWAIGLEHPQWSGMSVWAASQPLRGQLVEKSFFRFAGTISGTVVGVLLVMAMQVNPAFLVFGLTLWIGVCTWISNLQRGLVAYGTVLAGYSASMVSLLDTAHPDHIFLLGADRLATVLTGVIVATLIGYLFAQRTNEADLRARTRCLLADLLRNSARGDAGSENVELFARLAAIEESLDPHSAGSLRSRRGVRATRRVLLAAVPLLLSPAEADANVLKAAHDLDQGNVVKAAGFLQCTATVDLLNLADALVAWEPALRAQTAIDKTRLQPVALHQDWIGAREAALRAGGAILLFGLIWLVTGWSQGPLMLLGLSVMISLFSSLENPAITMRYVGFGQFLGTLAALACRWLVWPHAETEWQLILMMIPFIMVGALLVGHRRSIFVATDYSMLFLLLSQPMLPLTGTLEGSIVKGLAVLSAPLIAWVAYQLVFPINLQRRQQHVIDIMLQDIIAIAKSPDALRYRAIWQARFYHRVLRLVRISANLARAETNAVRISRAALLIAHAGMRLHQLVRDKKLPPAIRRTAEISLARLARITSRPERAATAFSRIAKKLKADDAVLMDKAAASVWLLKQTDAPPNHRGRRPK